MTTRFPGGVIEIPIMSETVRPSSRIGGIMNSYEFYRVSSPTVAVISFN